MYLRVLIAAALTAAALTMTGCQRLEQSLAPKPVVVTEEATAAIAAAPVVGDLAKDTPGDLPLWPQATVVASEKSDDAYSLELTTTDPYEDVLNGVAAGFERAQWTVAVEDDGEVGMRSAVLTVASGSYEGLITISEVDTGTVGIEYFLTAAAK